MRGAIKGTRLGRSLIFKCGATCGPKEMRINLRTEGNAEPLVGRRKCGATCGQKEMRSHLWTE